MKSPKLEQLQPRLPLRVLQLWMLLSLGICPSALRAGIVAPYTADASTLHLWHMDAGATPVPDAVATGGTNLTALANGATLTDASFSGFGTALNTYDGGPTATAASGMDASLSVLTLVNGTGDNVTMTLADPTTGAFTFEAIVRVDFDPAVNYGTVASGGNGRVNQMMIFSGENDVNTGRIFQFRIDPIGTLTPANTEVLLKFNNLNNGVSTQPRQMAIPSTGPNAIASNSWYHVAITYDGNAGAADALKFYWTLLDSSRTSANLIGYTNLASDLPTGSQDFCVGNSGRTASPLNFVGLIDEVRISSVARGPAEMVFAETRPPVTITAQPTNMVVGVGQTATFSISAQGDSPLGFQWRRGGSPMTGETQSVLTLPALQLIDSGAAFDVVVTNSFSSKTSEVAVLTVRTPENLAWLGQASSIWNTTDANWLNLGNSQVVAYAPGDHVLFDSRGSGVPTVTIPELATPNSVTVSADTTYTLTSTTGGGIAGHASLSKTGTGTLVLDTDCSYSGPTSIEQGVLQVGSGSGRGSLGTGLVTNHTALVFNRAGSSSVPGAISGEGSFTNLAGTVVVSGNNTCSGSVVVLGGVWSLAGPTALGNTTNVVVNPNARLSLSAGGINLGSRVSIQMACDGAGDLRTTLASTAGSNSIAGPIAVKGSPVDVSGSIQLYADSELGLLGDITAVGLSDKLLIRGSGTGGHLWGHFNVPLVKVIKTDTGTWTIHSTDNACSILQVAAGTLRLATHQPIPASASLQIGQSSGSGAANLDLGGYDLQVSAITEGTSSPRRIGNSSTTRDSRLSVVGVDFSSFSGVIQDSLSGGTRTVSLCTTGVSITLGGINTYSGETIISGGQLTLANDGSMINSSKISLVDGASLYVVSRYDSTLLVGTGQTLRCGGAVSMTGNLECQGSLELAVHKSGSLTSDSLNGASQITYGGTLKLLLSGNALTASDTIKLFDAGGYGGAFASTVPATPGPGLNWNTNTLATDGTLRITQTSVTRPSLQSSLTVGGNLLLSASGGVPATPCHVLASTNVALPLANWLSVATNNFDSYGKFTYPVTISVGVPRTFYVLQLP